MEQIPTKAIRYKCDLQKTIEQSEDAKRIALELIIQLNWALDCSESLLNIVGATDLLPQGVCAITSSGIRDGRQQVAKATKALNSLI